MHLAGLGNSQVPISVRHPGCSLHSSWLFTPNSTLCWGNELTQRASPEVFFFFFLKLFLMWTIFKVYIECIIIFLLFYVLVF